MTIFPLQMTKCACRIIFLTFLSLNLLAAEFQQADLYESVELFDLDESQLKEIFRKLAEANDITETLKPITTFDEIYKIRRARGSHYYVVEFNDSGVVHMLFNGRVAFLGSSHFFDKDQPKQMKAIYVDNEGHLNTISQEQVFLDSLPDTFSVTRCMQDIERSYWQWGFYRSAVDLTWHQSIHFAFNEFLFRDDFNCYKFQMNNSTLRKLHKKKLVRFNTYEFHQFVPEYGMKPESFSPFSIPFEIVVYHNEGAEILKDMMVGGELIRSACSEKITN